MRPELDILRHLFAIFVIFQHMPSESRYSHATNQQLLGFNDWIDGAVIGFFMISGCLYKAPKSLASYLPKHAVRILVPFFFFSLLYTLALYGLHKMSFEEGLRRTVCLEGAGMQLYFLPFFFIVTSVYTILSRPFTNQRLFVFDGIAFAALVVWTVLVPQPVSTGYDYKLLPLFGAALIFGRLLAQFKPTAWFWPLSLGLTAAVSALGFLDNQFFDLGLMALLVTLAQGITTPLPRIRVPGSGGVYLVHTPVLNYVISTELLFAGVTDWSNILLSVLLSYIISLAITLAVIRFTPQARWLLLE